MAVAAGRASLLKWNFPERASLAIKVKSQVSPAGTKDVATQVERTSKQNKNFEFAQMRKHI